MCASPGGRPVLIFPRTNCPSREYRKSQLLNLELHYGSELCDWPRRLSRLTVCDMAERFRRCTRAHRTPIGPVTPRPQQGPTKGVRVRRFCPTAALTKVVRDRHVSPGFPSAAQRAARWLPAHRNGPSLASGLAQFGLTRRPSTASGDGLVSHPGAGDKTPPATKTREGARVTGVSRGDGQQSYALIGPLEK